MADTKRTLEVVLTFRDKLTAGTKAALGGIKSFATQARALFGGITRNVFGLRGALLGLGGGLTIAGFAATVKSIANLGDELLAASQKTGLSVEALSNLKFAAEQSNVSFDTLVGGISKLQKNLSELALTGKGEAAEGLRLLSAETRQAAASGADLDEFLPLLVRDFENLGDEQTKVFVATKLFGRGAQELLPLLKEGKDGIEALTRQAHELGLEWSLKDAKAADEFGDSLGRLKGSLLATAQAIVKSLLPSFTTFFDSIGTFVREHQDEVIGFFKNILIFAQQTIAPLTQEVFRLAGAFTNLVKPLLDVQELVALKALSDAKFEVERLSQDIDKLSDGLKEARARGADVSLAEALIGADKAALKEAREDVVKLGKELRLLMAARQSMASGVSPGGGLLGDSIAALERAQRESVLRQGQARGDAFLRTQQQIAGSFQGPPPSAAVAANELRAIGPAISSAEEPLARVRTGVDGIISGLDELANRGLESFALLRGATVAAGDAVIDELARGLSIASSEYTHFGDVVREVGKDILQTLQQIIIKMALMKLFSTALGAFDFGGSSTTQADRIAVGKSGLLSTPEFKAPATPFKANALGTPFTTGPSVAGERGEDAVIPLPGNRKVPGQMFGSGGGGAMNVFINAIDVPTFIQYFRRGALQSRDLLQQLQVQAWQQNRGFRGKHA